MSQFKNVNVVYYYVTQWDAAKAFYDEILGWPIDWSDDDFGWREYGRPGETHIAISRWTEGEPPPKRAGATATLTVDDALQTAAWLKAKGIRCDDVVAIPGVVTSGTFSDPEGNRIQFASSAPESAGD
jgi:predicted enzyme related to lactoylglutathione lyase